MKYKDWPVYGPFVAYINFTKNKVKLSPKNKQQNDVFIREYHNEKWTLLTVKLTKARKIYDPNSQLGYYYYYYYYYY